MKDYPQLPNVKNSSQGRSREHLRSWGSIENLIARYSIFGNSFTKIANCTYDKIRYRVESKNPLSFKYLKYEVQIPASPFLLYLAELKFIKLLIMCHMAHLYTICNIYNTI